jgi:hypothetical protein
MTAGSPLVTDAQIEGMLRDRSVSPPPLLLGDVLRLVDATPQRRALPWQVPGRSRWLLAFAVLALLVVALAGAIAIGSRPPRLHTALLPYANGEIVTHGDGCALVAIDPSTGTTRPFFAGVQSLGPDGKVCGPTTTGLLSRRPVRAASFVYIGKEANEIDDVDAGLVHDLGEVQLTYGMAGDPWPAALATLREMPTGELARMAGVDRKTIQRTLRGASQPRPELKRRLIEIARRHPRRAVGREGPPSDVGSAADAPWPLRGRTGCCAVIEPDLSGALDR